MLKQKSPLVEGRPGDIVAIDIGNGEFCYLRLYQFGRGVLPFLSRGLVREVATFPALSPRFFTQTWVYDSDTTPMFHVGHVPFATEAESYGLQDSRSLQRLVQHYQACHRERRCRYGAVSAIPAC
jgi:hypothetical protein